MQRRLSAVLPVVAVALWAAAGQAFGSHGKTIAFCHDNQNRPPSLYFAHGRWQGHDMDVLNQLFASSERDFHLEALPWQRCMQSTAKGENHQVVLSATYSARRAQRYYFSDSYYSLAPGYLYTTADGRSPPDISRPSDFFRYRVCGMSGFNYDGFGIANAQMDRGAKDLPQLIAKLVAGRCDIALTQHDVAQALKHRHRLPWPDGLALRKVPHTRPVRYYMMVSRQAPNARQILHFINRGIQRLDTPAPRSP